MSSHEAIIRAPWFQAASTRKVMELLGPTRTRFVGGIVRDTLLGRLPDPLQGQQGFGDVDIATQVLPDDVMALAERAGIKAVPTGIAHGTVTLVVDHIPYEVTTLRKDVETDGRRAVVAFTAEWAEDALRRDFTFNALYADSHGVIHDVTGQGLEDLAANRVRFIGAAEDRIREDYLRILRYFRFSAMFRSSALWEKDTLSTCQALSEGIDRLSSERMRIEMLKLLSLENPADAVEQMQSCTVLHKVLPGASVSDWFRALCGAEVTGLSPTERALVRLFALSEGKTSLDRLRLSNAEQKLLRQLSEGVRPGLAGTQQAVDEALFTYGRDAARVLLCAYAVHPEWQGDPGLSPGRLLTMVRERSVPVFPVKAAQVMDQTGETGAALGQSLTFLENRWIRNGFRDSAGDLLALLPALKRSD